MVKGLTQTFGAAAVSMAGLSLFSSFAGAANEQDLFVNDILQDMQNSGYTQPLDSIPQDTALDGYGLSYADAIDMDNEIGNILAMVMEEEQYTSDMANGHFMSMGKVGAPVVGQTFVDFCKDNPDYCVKNADEALPLSRDEIPGMKSAFSEFFQGTTYATDASQFGKDDVWGAGVYVEDLQTGKTLLQVDCEDTVLFGMQYLNERQQIDYSSMSMLIVNPNDPENPSLHAVLLVRTDDGDYVLNNDGQAMLAADAMKHYGYTPIQAQAFEDKSMWQVAELKPFGVEATMEMLPEYAEVELPRPRPDRNGPI